VHLKSLKAVGGCLMRFFDYSLVSNTIYSSSGGGIFPLLSIGHQMNKLILQQYI